MEQTESPSSSIFATEPIGRLIAKFAIPCVISLLVNSLYNIVDQIFIGWGVGYLGNGATNIVFPITIVAFSLSLMIGDGGAAYLSLKLGEGDIESAKKGVGNAIVLVTVVSILLAAVFLIGINPILDLFGATDVLRPYALQYGTIIGLGLPFMMIPGAINSMIRADGSPKYAMFSMALGIPCYDQELIQKIAAESGFHEGYVQDAGEDSTGGFLASAFTSHLQGHSNADYLWKVQYKIITDLAQKGPCVIVGRCADYILRDTADCLRVFIHADLDFRARRIVEVYGEREESPEQRLREKDKRRAAYHRFYTDMKWGHAQNYDLTLNSGTLGIDRCVQIITELY